jgi:hypothetical protein
MFRISHGSMKLLQSMDGRGAILREWAGGKSIRPMEGIPMNRRHFLNRSLLNAFGLAAGVSTGCRGRQRAHVMKEGERDRVGSHAAGAETYGHLIDESVAKLLGRHSHAIQTVGMHDVPPQPLRICFIGVENKSAEEIGDFKDQIYQNIDTQIVQSRVFHPVNKRFVDAALDATRIRPDQLFLPQNSRMFSAYLEQEGQPFDFLLFATLTSGSTRDNNKMQRDYLLTLELVNIHTGDYDKESAMLRKSYKKAPLGF